jgi:phytoene synthase
VAALPLACRPGIYAARHIYGGIGTAVARLGHDSISQRAHTGPWRKLGWLALSLGRSGASMVVPCGAVLHAAPIPEVAFLVSAASRAAPQRGRSETVLSVLAQLEARDRNLA